MTTKKIEPAVKLTTREVTDSQLLMIMIASKRSEKSRTAERVAQTVEAELRDKNADAPSMTCA